MNINRLLSRREKDGNPHRRQKSRDKSRDISIDKTAEKEKETETDLEKEKEKDKKTQPLPGEGIASLFKCDPQTVLDQAQATKVQTVKKRLQDAWYLSIGDEQINYGLFSKHAGGNVDKAVELIILVQESVEGVIKPYNPSVHMYGAENRQGVTCYLDALLFAMFARLGSFEPILYTIYDDEPRRRLSTLIRLWVNMLRTGMLIQTDMTRHLQEALGECGWPDATLLEQQDTSEAFSFITEKLQLPLLTLKMDIYHDGPEDAKDDHRLVHERLLEVAVPPAPEDGSPIRLEDCLESYFNNRVEVKRHLGRSNTVSSMGSAQTSSADKEGAPYVEISELPWSEPGTPISPTVSVTSTFSRPRAASIIQRRFVPEDEHSSAESDSKSTHSSLRRGSLRKEVLMPAWQFFNLIRPLPFSLYIKPLNSVLIDVPVLIGDIAWYTKSSISSDANIAAHFSQSRPVLGICLKRYEMTADGRSARKNTLIDIPLEIGLPHFISDDREEDEGPGIGNFKLSLQSVICHRGNSVHSGHYISLIRGSTLAADGDIASDRRLSNASEPPQYPVDRWIRHDDLGIPRVGYIDISQALKDEMPYLLFYQVTPIYAGSDSTTSLTCDPPSYDAGISMTVTDSTPQVDRDPYHARLKEPSYFERQKEDTSPATGTLSEVIEPNRQSLSLPDERRGSITFTEESIGSTASSVFSPETVKSAPPTPNEETTAQRLSRAASRFRKSGSKSRPTSSSGENRISATFSRMALKSKDQLAKLESGTRGSLPATDGTSEPPPELPVFAVQEVALKPPNPPSRKASKRGRKRDSAKEPLEEAGEGSHHHHRHVQKTKGKDVPDRECMIM